MVTKISLNLYAILDPSCKINGMNPRAALDPMKYPRTNTMSTPRITVLIPTFNRGKYISECLGSILQQTLPASQIIVVNDGSTDNTKKVCMSYGDKIDYLESNQLGKPGALNVGLKKVTGDYLWIFDDDDVALPEALKRIVEPLEQNPQCGFSYCTFYKTATQENSHRIGKILSVFPIPDLQKRGFLIPLFEANFLGGAAVFARTSCYHTLGEFDPKLTRSQDYEMAIRISRKYPGVRVEGGPTFHYRQHNGLRGSNQDRFKADYIGIKWLKYDQMFFRTLYRDISLEEYLPPGLSLENAKRQAILQRMNIMASKLLIPEMINDLYHLISLNNSKDFSEEEYLVIRDMIFRSLYAGEVSVYYYSDFYLSIRLLASSSQLINKLRKKIFQAICERFKKHRSLGEFVRNIRPVCQLYLFPTS